MARLPPPDPNRQNVEASRPAMGYRGGLAEQGTLEAALMKAKGWGDFTAHVYKLSSEYLDAKQRQEFALANAKFLRDLAGAKGEIGSAAVSGETAPDPAASTGDLSE